MLTKHQAVLVKCIKEKKKKKKKSQKKLKKFWILHAKLKKKRHKLQKKKQKLCQEKLKKNLWLTGTVRCPLTQPFYKSLGP